MFLYCFVLMSIIKGTVRIQLVNTMLYFLTLVFSVIRELSSRALHNLTPQAPDYMAETGKQCHFTCFLGNWENKLLGREDF